MFPLVACASVGSYFYAAVQPSLLLIPGGTEVLCVLGGQVQTQIRILVRAHPHGKHVELGFDLELSPANGSLPAQADRRGLAGREPVLCDHRDIAVSLRNRDGDLPALLDRFPCALLGDRSAVNENLEGGEGS